MLITVLFIVLLLTISCRNDGEDVDDALQRDL